ncbi:hypothetical protein CVD28_02635 [Bacillus sp. M6-12]|uniref:BC1872 family protein n=1 Tax=Bacillus sp. M6-12 TaxID=2054166 RepID=UPI000C78616D|nr:hypothetical protein [Bacillus sp. M6-12]PLS19329.1 hypothetical protein CVD28_02635 [Bacillus sp. M6-12]
MNKEFDKLVAEKVMGWTQIYTVGYPEPHTIAYKDEEGKTHSGFTPSVDLEDAWMALDKVCKDKNWRAIIDRNQTQTEVNFKNQMGADAQHYGIASTPMLAICLAVLETVGIVFEEEF